MRDDEQHDALLVLAGIRDAQQRKALSNQAGIRDDEQRDALRVLAGIRDEEQQAALLSQAGVRDDEQRDALLVLADVRDDQQRNALLDQAGIRDNEQRAALLVLADVRDEQQREALLDQAEDRDDQQRIALQDQADVRDNQERAATLQDRDRIAKDLHDHVIQRLFGAGLTVQSIAAGLAKDTRAVRLTQIVEDLDGTIRQIRASIFGLRGRLGPPTGTVRLTLLNVATEASDILGFNARMTSQGPVAPSFRTIFSTT